MHSVSMNLASAFLQHNSLYVILQLPSVCVLGLSLFDWSGERISGQAIRKPENETRTAQRKWHVQNKGARQGDLATLRVAVNWQQSAAENAHRYDV